MKIEVTKEEAIILLNLVRKKRDKFREMNMNYRNKKEPNNWETRLNDIHLEMESELNSLHEKILTELFLKEYQNIARERNKANRDFYPSKSK